MYKEQCSKGEAINKAKSLAGQSSRPQSLKAVKLEAETGKSNLARIAVLGKVMSEARQSLQRSNKGQAYCKERNLDYIKLEIGFLEERYHRNWNTALKASGLEIGLLTEQENKTLSPVLRNCLIFPIRNKSGQIVNLYGRSIAGKNHYYLKGRHQGLYPCYPKAETQRLILTESLIDAATLAQYILKEEYEILACYGTNGFTIEHEEIIKVLKGLEEVIFFFDGDDAGRAGAERISEILKTYNLKLTTTIVPTPEGEDINSLAQGHAEEAAELFPHLLSQRTTLEKQIASTENRSLLTEAETLQEPKSCISSNPIYPSSDSLDITNPDKITYETEAVKITIWGGIEKHNLHRLKLSLSLENKGSGQSFRDDVNLYSNRSFKQFLQNACEELGVLETFLKNILQDFTKEVENYRLDQKEKAAIQNRPEKVELSGNEQKEAIEHLKDKSLVKSLRYSMQQCGLIGETDNGLLLFLIFLTRYFDSPLHALVHGSSGSGKTNLLKTILKLVPEECKYETTALTENVLFRPPYRSFWKNKILLLEDLDGSYKALLPLREFMTAQRISKFVTESDPRTGAFKQVHLQAEGPICIAGATTKDKIYEDNSNRSFLIHVNESKAHQDAVLDYQNKQAAGLTDTTSAKQTAQKVHNIQRMLNHNLKVINPFQPSLKLPEYVFKKLRTNTHYITLIQSITFLHQYQREIKQSRAGEYYIETTLEDVELANLLSKESLLRKSDELSGAVREFFESLKSTVRQTNRDTFTGKEIREQFRMHPMQFNRRITELQARGYLKQAGGNQKTGYEYTITTWDDYKVLQSALNIMDDTLSVLWQKYPDGKYNRSIT
ncbi:DNA primase [Sporocytophaga myxococcoides]|uniref:DNA primase n=2 Tax=Sporocytophaga myxococcoides TaxID=153721 RepID=A0A098LFN7_9BACT|nr:DNA primase [Sporocytophaga myxococcoides]